MSTRFVYRTLIFFWVVCAALALGAVAQDSPTPPSPMKMDHPAVAKKGPANVLTVTFGETSQKYTLQDLASLDHHAIDVVNGHTKANEHYAGVLLSTLLTKVGVPDKPHGKDFRLYLVAEGADGYQVVYSLGEVSPDVHDGTVIVADRLGVETLADTGPFQLVATGEKRPARWVRNLVSIRVLTAP